MFESQFCTVECMIGGSMNAGGGGREYIINNNLGSCQKHLYHKIIIRIHPDWIKKLLTHAKHMIKKTIPKSHTCLEVACLWTQRHLSARFRRSQIYVSNRYPTVQYYDSISVIPDSDMEPSFLTQENKLECRGGRGSLKQTFFSR